MAIPARHWDRGNPMTRFIAVDWSGAKAGARSAIWLAEARDGRLARLESGRGRSEVVDHLIGAAASDPGLVVGLDFAFSFPLWFTERAGARSVEELWSVVAKKGEQWLGSCEDPFWGRPGRRRPKLPEDLRRTEREASAPKGPRPKSVFQIGGAGAVGTGSIRGMPYLTALRSAGFSIWPFHDPALPLVIEIYPRLLTGPVVKAREAERSAYLARCLPRIGGALARKAVSSPDAFDAAVSAVVMSRHADEIAALARSRDPVERIEGRIWWPRGGRKEAAAAPPRWPGKEPGCPFCEIPRESVVAESRHALAIRDRYPVSRGHTVVVPKAHTVSLFEQGLEIQADTWRLVARVRGELQEAFGPDGLNIGLNDGRAAGQTVEHAHVHLIPRFEGDVADPRGGIRWVLPSQAAYWDE